MKRMKKANSIIKIIASAFLVGSIIMCNPAFVYAYGTNSYGLTADDTDTKEFEDDSLKSSDDAEVVINAGYASCDDFDTKVVGSDGVAYEGVEYLSIGALSRLEEDTRQEYYDICDEVAEDISGGIDADVVIAVDENGDLNMLAMIAMQAVCGERVWSDSHNATAKEDVIDDNNTDKFAVLSDEKPENVDKDRNEKTDNSHKIISENMDLLEEMDCCEETDIVIPGNAFEVTNANRNYFRNQLTNNGKIIFDSVCYAAQNGVNTATVLTGNMSLSDCVCGISAALNTYVKAFEWLDGNRYLTINTGSNSTTIKFSKSKFYSYEQERKALSTAELVASRAREYAKSNCPSDIPYGIIEYINEWVCQSSYYNNAGLGDRDRNTVEYYNCHNSFGVLLNGYGVCEGYAKATSRILDCAGIRNLYVVGDTNRGLHAWNYVYLNGAWYWLDTTWNDYGDYASKRYFLAGTELASNSSRFPTGNQYTGGMNFSYPNLSACYYTKNTYGVYDPTPDKEPSPIENPAPVIKSYVLPDATINKYYYESVSVTGASPASYSIISGALPKGLKMDASGRVSGTPTVIGSSNFKVRIQNVYGKCEGTIKIKVNAVPPQIITNSLQDGEAGIKYNSRIIVNGTAPIKLSILNGSLPAGLLFNSETGEISGIPTAEGTNTFTVKAENSAGSVRKTFSIRISVDEPEILSDLLSDGICGEYYKDAIIHETKLPVDFSICTGVLPKGLVLDKTTGIVCGTPTETGSYSFGVKAENQFGKSDKKQIRLCVRGRTPEIVTKNIPKGTVGEKYRAEIEVLGGSDTLLNFLEDTVIPDGLKISRNNGNIVISGIPTKAGLYSMGFLLNNSYGRDVKTYTMEIYDKKEEDNTPVPLEDKTLVLVVNQKYDISGLFSKEYKKYAVGSTKMAKVSSKGIITAKKEGIVKISGMVKKDGKWVSSNESVIIEIEKPYFMVSTIQAAKVSSTIKVAQYISGTKANPSKWSSSNSRILSIDEKTGEANAIKAGKTKVTACFGEGKYAAKYSVVIKITIPKLSKTKIRLKTGETYTLLGSGNINQ